MAKATTSARRAAFDLAEHREELKALAERHGFRELSVFGSVARGEDTADSDIDLLVSGSETSTYFHLVAFESAARRLLEWDVDVVFREGLRVPIDNDVLRDARWL